MYKELEEGKKTGERFYLTWLMIGKSFFFFSQSNIDEGAPAWGETTRTFCGLTVGEVDKVLEPKSGRSKKIFFSPKSLESKLLRELTSLLLAPREP